MSTVNPIERASIMYALKNNLTEVPIVTLIGDDKAYYCYIFNYDGWHVQYILEEDISSLRYSSLEKEKGSREPDFRSKLLQITKSINITAIKEFVVGALEKYDLSYREENRMRYDSFDLTNYQGYGSKKENGYFVHSNEERKSHFIARWEVHYDYLGMKISNRLNVRVYKKYVECQICDFPLIETRANIEAMKLHVESKHPVEFKEGIRLWNYREQLLKPIPEEFSHLIN